MIAHIVRFIRFMIRIGRKLFRNRGVRMRGREKRAVLLMTVLLAAIGTVAGVRGSQLGQEIRENDQRRSVLEQQLEDETARTAEIQEMEQYMNSDGYIEKIAREKLGLLKENEILFREK